MRNVGSFDRAFRFALGAALVAAPFLLAGAFAPLGAWRFAVAAWGVVMLGTAAFRFCPAYTLLGIRTCPVARA
ncbi:DUF2892 domain-containing protein [Roseomonas sp. AR75]|jgi:hypothetical protein|uniref:YgaP family membrane protein n=1 Tax=Roseomonas sp. AR75 TaxID=2562311 RepID=UPI0010C0626E|nr:DUF2892 domain-containing protein [Roseomonas sp. AR75]